MSAVTGKIDIVDLDDTLLTSFGPGGSMVDKGGKRWPDAQMLTVAASRKLGRVWKGSRATALHLVELDAAWSKATGRRLRITSPWRDGRQQANLRLPYQRWLDAGEPTDPAKGWDPRTMSQTAANRPDESQHQWGGAADLDTKGFCEDDHALAAFWSLASQFGFTPIIVHPVLTQSESWHFDHTGPLHELREALSEVSHGNAYATTATVGCYLAGTHTKNSLEGYAQSRLLLEWADLAPQVRGEVYPGPPDGIIGKHTLALAAKLLPSLKPSPTVQDILNALAGMEDPVGLKVLDAA